MDIAIRKATIGDFERLFPLKIESKVDEQRFTHSTIRIEDAKEYYGDYLERDLESPYRAVFIAERNDGEIIGMVIGRIYRALKAQGYERRASVSNLYVAEHCRKRGCGKRLLDTLTDWFIARGVSGVTLSIHRKNTPARDLYLKTGFQDQFVSMYKKL